jgi:uncharacterized protein YjcR
MSKTLTEALPELEEIAKELGIKVTIIKSWKSIGEDTLKRQRKRR